MAQDVVCALSRLAWMPNVNTIEHEWHSNGGFADV